MILLLREARKNLLSARSAEKKNLRALLFLAGGGGRHSGETGSPAAIKEEGEEDEEPGWRIEI